MLPQAPVYGGELGALDVGALLAHPESRSPDPPAAALGAGVGQLDAPAHSTSSSTRQLTSLLPSNVASIGTPASWSTVCFLALRSRSRTNMHA